MRVRARVHGKISPIREVRRGLNQRVQVSFSLSLRVSLSHVQPRVSARSREFGYL